MRPGCRICGMRRRAWPAREMAIMAAAWGHRNAEPRWKAEASRQQIAAFEPKAFVYPSRARPVFPRTRPCAPAPGRLWRLAMAEVVASRAMLADLLVLVPPGRADYNLQHRIRSEPGWTTFRAGISSATGSTTAAARFPALHLCTGA